jgi:hypothetical protein
MRSALLCLIGSAAVASFCVQAIEAQPVADKTPVASAPKRNELRDTLLVLNNQLWEALSKNDLDTMGKIVATDWVGFDPGGAHWNRTQFLEFYRDTRIHNLKFLSEREVFRLNEHTALMTYEVMFQGESRKGPSSCHQRNVWIWVQRDGGWFLKYSQCTHLPVPMASAAPENPLKGGPLADKDVLPGKRLNLGPAQ